MEIDIAVEMTVLLLMCVALVTAAIEQFRVDRVAPPDCKSKLHHLSPWVSGPLDDAIVIEVCRNCGRMREIR